MYAFAQFLKMGISYAAFLPPIKLSELTTYTGLQAVCFV